MAFLDRYYDTVLQGLLTLDTGTIDGRGVAVGMGFVGQLGAGVAEAGSRSRVRCSRAKGEKVTPDIG